MFIEDIVKTHLDSLQSDKPTATGTLMRCSDAGSCQRARAFKAAKIPQTEEFDGRTLVAFELGNALHTVVQQALAATLNDEEFYDGFEAEVVVDLTHLGVSLSGHADGVITRPDGGKSLVEIKTMSGYGAKVTFGKDPKIAHVAQAGLYALGLDCDEVIIVYVAKESVMRTQIKPGDIYQWTLSMDQEAAEGKTVREIAAEELVRFRNVELSVKLGMIPVPLVSKDDSEDVELANLPGIYGSRTKHWECGYCMHNSICYEIGIEPQEINFVNKLMEGMYQ
jgi:hypothetical protein